MIKHTHKNRVMKNQNLADVSVGYTNNICKVEKIGNQFQMITAEGINIGNGGANTKTRKNAYESAMALREHVSKTGRKSWKGVSMEDYNMMIKPLKENGEVNIESTNDHSEIKKIIHEDSLKLKPENLIIKDIKWKYLIRSAVRGKNIMMTGAAGCGKTMAAKHLVTQLQRPDFYFNLGSTQDPRATLIGNTQFSKEKGTFFSESAFIKAIKTPNAIILLDELSRAHPDAWNILMTVLDANQRYLRLDEAEGSPIVNVAEGVTFIATANIGNEYTATRVLDRAILDRFVMIEMDLLNSEEELTLLKKMYPEVNEEDLKAVAEIAHNTREVSRSEVAKLTNMISTRASVEMGGLLYDGFTLMEAAEVAILPFFSQDGGLESERTYVKQLVQKYIKTTDENLFNEVKDEAPDSDTIVW
jgi:nitric oxide reductase NorQ protein